MFTLRINKLIRGHEPDFDIFFYYKSNLSIINAKILNSLCNRRGRVWSGAEMQRYRI